MFMVDTFIWLGAAVVFALVEMMTYNLVTIWFALGAVGAFILSLFSVPLWVQVTGFVFISAILLVFTKPLVKRKLDAKKIPTNADRVIGAEALVTQSIDPVNGAGLVKVLGQVWSAKSEDESCIAEGEKVTVKQIQGVKLVVSK
jgi:membrane protein implicated in regulation of membrane protease activity